MKRKCSKCGRELPLTSEFFYKDNRNKDGLRTSCKKCYKEYYYEHREKIRAVQRKYDKEHQKEKLVYQEKYLKIKKNIFKDIKNKSSCALCGEDDYRCLDFHHVNPKDKKYNPSARTVFRKDFIDELQKCICLCCKCHRKIHYKEE